ncbi:hypothetical protein V8E55_009244 [Tylopilus felleus]
MGWLSFQWFKSLVLGETFELGSDDIVVFVVGPSGGGKSLFVEETTKSGLTQVGADLRPCTAKVHAIRYKLTEAAKTTFGATYHKHIVFVDTPSFHTDQDDGAAERNMTQWLSKSKCKSTLAGTIYIHRVETDPHNESIQEHLNAFAYTFPHDFVPLPRRVHAVLSYEGVIPEATIQLRMETLQAQLYELQASIGISWIASFHPNLFQSGDPETAWEAVVALFTHRPTC